MFGLAFLAPLASIAGKVLDFLKSPLGVALVIAAAYAVGFWRGERMADARCDAQAQISREMARQIDTKAAEDARLAAERDARANAQRAESLEKKVKEYEDELAKRGPDGRCNLGDGDLGRMQPDHPADRVPIPPRRR